MIRAAGMMFITPDDRVLLMHRMEKAKEDGQQTPGSWAFPGGGIEGEETAEQAARREIEEETGLKYEGKLTLWTRRIKEDVDFTTFLAPVAEPFVPTMNEEHNAFHWINRSFALAANSLSVPNVMPPLVHPGCIIALERFDLDELGVAKAMAAGELTSPQMYNDDLMLIALRITGTGVSFRPAVGEYVLRDPAIYMNPEFLERCQGLPVIFRHPKKTLLNTDEFRERIVGTIFVPFLRPEVNEVWGIAKILDMGAAELLKTHQMSTSPAVMVLGDKVAVPDGRKILIEDKPFLLDHLAILIPEFDKDGKSIDSGAGVWDRGEGLKGVESVDAIPLSPPDEVTPIDKIFHAIMSLKIDEIASRADSL
jgi:8-oxo-dGTP pyrophosphatase MutT (NUDIX family)